MHSYSSPAHIACWEGIQFRPWTTFDGLLEDCRVTAVEGWYSQMFAAVHFLSISVMMILFLILVAFSVHLKSVCNTVSLSKKHFPYSSYF